MELLPLGQVTGHRGRKGELTVKVLGGDGSLWAAVPRVWIVEGKESEGRFYGVEESRAYRDKLVLKLEGVDSSDDAAALRGRRVMAGGKDAPRLAEGVYYADRLIGMRVLLEDGEPVGRVVDLMRTGGTDLLVVVAEDERSVAEDDGGDSPRKPHEVMIPLAKRIVIEVNEEAQEIVVRPPDGLLELNRPGESGQERG